MRPFGYLTFNGWPRVMAVILVAILTVVAGASITSDRPVYVESATVLFAPPPLYTSAVAYTWQEQSLIATGSVISQVIMGPQIADQIRAAGGRAAYDLSLFNLYNDDYPNYSYPEALLTISSPAEETTRNTYLVAKRMIIEVLTNRQERAGSHAGDLIVASFTDNTGPVEETGSPKRSLAGLLLLALVCGGTAWSTFSRTRLVSQRRLVSRRSRHRHRRGAAWIAAGQRRRDPLTRAAIPQSGPSRRRRRGQHPSRG
jgi:hypothetical protein